MGYLSLIKILGPLLIVIGIITYAVHLKGYETKYERIKQEFAEYKTTQETASKENQKASEDLTKEIAERTSAERRLSDQYANLNKERILLADELKKVKLTNKTIELFNDSAGVTVSRVPNDTDAIESNTTTPTTKAKQGDATSPITTPSVTLQDLLLVATENNHRLLMCNQTVEDWQHFWRQVEKIY